MGSSIHKKLRNSLTALNPRSIIISIVAFSVGGTILFSNIAGEQAEVTTPEPLPAPPEEIVITEPEETPLGPRETPSGTSTTGSGQALMPSGAEVRNLSELVGDYSGIYTVSQTGGGYPLKFTIYSDMRIKGSGNLPDSNQQFSVDGRISDAGTFKAIGTLDGMTVEITFNGSFHRRSSGIMGSGNWSSQQISGTWSITKKLN